MLQNIIAVIAMMSGVAVIASAVIARWMVRSDCERSDCAMCVFAVIASAVIARGLFRSDGERSDCARCDASVESILCCSLSRLRSLPGSDCKMSAFKQTLLKVAEVDKRDEAFVDVVIGLLKSVEITETEHIQGESIRAAIPACTADT